MSQRTPLYDLHVQLGAKLIPFAGFDMPVRYTGDVQEHMAVRQAAGMFDISHMGEFIVRGPQALALIQLVISNDASKLTPGKAQYACMPNAEGGIVDDVIVYYIREDQYMIVVNASNIQKDWDWISAANVAVGAELIDVSDRTALIAVSGPNAEAVVQPFTDTDLSGMKTYECFKGTFDGAEKSLVATTGYTGERTFEIFLYREHAVRVWQDLLAAGQPYGLIPCGLGARDTLRLEMGYMLYGNDINDTTSPLEAGLGWITKLNKGPFKGAGVIAALKATGLSRRLVGFELTDKGIPRAGYEIAAQGQVIGTVTSGSVSPVLGKGIGMGYVPVAYAAEGTELEIIVRGKGLPAQVVRTPFIRK
ncbi:MAG: glycine cleavage system aminomethyltransferase GcvT [Bacteroidia bacterium]|nr:glycine cleavage system aminomethyltransferase GcvT [Bacteroidia bacterium]